MLAVKRVSRTEKALSKILDAVFTDCAWQYRIPPSQQSEFTAKHELVNKRSRVSETANGIISPPGYPFDARRLLGDLRGLLGTTSGRRMYYEELGQLMGKSKSTAHFWFEIH